eukprot:CAMPEP_0178412712 /NCGR_PEP_ID=MMETSP0689_2-20121128/22158_1 /TAXON_ID=160604 /ORGANISM="Amphidinium massartii, Strain CS-259" /LENGTH=302 /DNA_ID=CAMNT_0020033971 /DNA_START=59 /DNA_END=964 /DNA_ORIENTATION=+
MDLLSFVLAVTLLLRSACAESEGGIQAQCLNNMEVQFKPAHFSCMSCDVTTCGGQYLICDPAKCLGKMLMQECWCKQAPGAAPSQALKDLSGAAASFGGAAGGDGTLRFHCDENCMGGACDTAGLQCRKREEVCDPWWLCSDEPPAALTQLSSTDSLQEHSEAGSKHVLQRGLWQQQHHRGHLRSSGSRALQTASAVAPQRQYNFQAASFECDTAFVPLPVENPVTHKLEPPGIIVFDKRACSGSLLTNKCVCWDNYKYLLGKDPLASEFMCDNSCTAGPCGGRTCALHQPPPLLLSDKADV